METNIDSPSLFNSQCGNARGVGSCNLLNQTTECCGSWRLPSDTTLFEHYSMELAIGSHRGCVLSATDGENPSKLRVILYTEKLEWGSVFHRLFWLKCKRNNCDSSSASRLSEGNERDESILIITLPVYCAHSPIFTISASLFHILP
jgi:hypothetical protein